MSLHSSADVLYQKDQVASSTHSDMMCRKSPPPLSVCRLEVRNHAKSHEGDSLKHQDEGWWVVDSWRCRPGRGRQPTGSHSIMKLFLAIAAALAILSTHVECFVSTGGSPLARGASWNVIPANAAFVQPKRESRSVLSKDHQTP